MDAFERGEKVFSMLTVAGVDANLVSFGDRTPAEAMVDCCNMRTRIHIIKFRICLCFQQHSRKHLNSVLTHAAQPSPVVNI